MYKKAILILSLFFVPSLQSFSGLPEKKIVIIIPSFNNAKSYMSNLISVVSQDYDNWRIIYIDDASTDRTGDLVAQFIIDNQLEDKITLIRNDYNRKALANLYKAAQLCNPTDIILELDGDDSLAEPHILAKINELFSTTDTWFAYAQYKNVPEHLAKENKISILGYARPTPQALIESREFRTKWLWSGLRMYYAWLFHQIKLEDLILPQAPYNGKFFPTSKDGACAYPMLEMSGYKIKHISDVWLLRNINTPLNDYKIARELQLHCGATLKQSPQYDRLDHQMYNNQTHPTDALSDMIVLGDNASTLELCTALSSYYKHAHDLGQIYLLYRTNSEKYEYISSIFPDITFIQCPGNQDTHQIITDMLSTMNDYVLLSNGKSILKEKIHLSQCIKLLNSTYAYAFYLQTNLSSMGNPEQKSILPCEQIVEDIYAWKFNCVYPYTPHGDPNLLQQTHIHNFNMTLYRTKDVMAKMASMNIATLHDFELEWKKSTISMRKIGLFFGNGKV